MSAGITADTVRQLANLAMIQLDDEEIAEFQQELTAILGYIDELMAIDLDDCEPTYQVSGQTSVMRPDVVGNDEVTPSQLLALAPQPPVDNHYKVERTLQ